MYRIVLLTENGLTEHDVLRIAQLHGQSARVHVLVPVAPPHNPVLETLDEVAVGELRRAVHEEGADMTKEQARRLAEAALADSLEGLQVAGVEAQGELVDGDPVAPTVAAAQDADEIMVFTEPHLVETALRRDWASRIRRRTEKPVLHAVSGTDRVL